MKRRNLLFAGLATAGLTVGGAWLWRNFDGRLRNPCGAALPAEITDSEIWQRIWDGLEPARIWDVHTHVAGLGHGNTGIWVNPDTLTWRHPLRRAQIGFYFNAACVENNPDVDVAYSDRLVAMTESLPPRMKLMLLAYDWHRGGDGEPIREHSTFFVPNRHVRNLVRQHPQRFEWMASIHPYRKDALARLEWAAEQGARAVKWLPPGQGMDPLSPRCDAFYRKLVQLKLPLLTHAGLEKAVHGGDTQKLGNPLRLRRPLDLGVTVIVSHCASLGEGEDLDRGNGAPRVANFEFFKRLMGERDYEGRLYGDISAVLQINRQPRVLKTLLSERAWQDRLLQGSDYPLPGVMPLISLHRLIADGLLDKRWQQPLQLIRGYNPVLFDFAVKRLLAWRGHSFDPRVFETRRVFRPTDEP